jgi:hypothetical protein
MKRSSALLKADIRDEIARLQRAITEYREAIAGTDLSAPELPSFTKAAIASYVHAFYTGCEHVFRVVSAFFENELDPARWHADLLKRMRLEIPGVRPRVLSDALAAELDLYRGFGHVFREAYGHELHWRRLRPLAERMADVSRETFAQIERFVADLPDEIPDSEER